MLSSVDTSWHETLNRSLGALASEYRTFLDNSTDYFPRKEILLNAFGSLPKEKVKYILFGQDPYPREQSAIGYAFIDGAVEELFSDTGLSKAVNRATSLRNFVKMALVADGRLSCSDTSQEAIASLEKSDLITRMMQLRKNFERNGVLLLNTALVFTDKKESRRHIKAWGSFIEVLLGEMQEQKPTLILFGTHAKEIKKVQGSEKFTSITMEHPYNHTFIQNLNAHELFGRMRLLSSN